MKAFIFIADFVSGSQCEYCVDIWTLSALEMEDHRLYVSLLNTCLFGWENRRVTAKHH